MKKSLKISLIIAISVVVLIFIATLALFGYFIISTNDVTLDLKKLDGNYTNVKILDDNNALITQKNNGYTKFNEVSPYIIKAFVAVEDQKFFKHKGVDIKRMGVAFVKNIFAGGFKEGASTITQQLIKNTHLTNKKTIKRKLEEIRLAVRLEKKLSKEQIMEKYLNNLYFGGGIYGINDACLAFFNKKPNELNLAESAMLVGVVKNPRDNSPLNNFEGSIKRKNVVLSVLEKSKEFDANSVNIAKNEKIVINNGLIHNKINQSFIKNCLKESSLLLNIDEKEISNKGYRILTYLDSNLQKQVFTDTNSTCLENDFVRCSLKNDSLGVSSYVTNLPLYDDQISRQAGSIIKPFSVYLPAFENKLINPLTQILDEKTNFNGYSPQNYNGVFHGYVSVKDSVAHSYNIPAVKLLDKLGVQSSLNFLSRYDIAVDENNQNLSLALGSNNISPLQIASCYASLANNGYFEKAHFVKKIIDVNGKVVYEYKSNSKKVVESDTNFLMLDCLKETVQNGTGYKLKNFDFQIACKTGTVANKNGKNIDAWCCAFTSKDTFLAWDGAKPNKVLKDNHTGSAYPTFSIKDSMLIAYNNIKPKDFIVPNTVKKIKIDSERLQKQQEIFAVDENFAGKFIESYFSTNNLPSNTQIDDNIKIYNGFFENIIEFEGINGAFYEIYRKNAFDCTLIAKIECNGGKIRFVDKKPNIFSQYDYQIKYVNKKE